MNLHEDPTAADDAIRAIQAGGDREAQFKALFGRYYRPLVYFFRNQRASAEDSEDLAQETLIRALRSVNDFEFKASFDSWVFLIARNVWSNAWRERKAGKRSAPEVALDASVDERDGAPAPLVARLAAPGDDPLEEVLERERQQEVEVALGELPPGLRVLVELRVGQELRYREIAKALQISTETVKSQLRVARDRLRPRLARYFGRVDFEEPGS